MDRQRDGFPRASMRETDVCGQHTMREPRQRLFGVVRMDRGHAPEMAGVESLQEVERLRTTNLPYEDPIGTMAQCRPNQVGDGHGWHRLLLAKRYLGSSRLEPNEIGLVDENFGRLFDQDNTVLRRNRLRHRVEKRGLTGACAARNENVMAGFHRCAQNVRKWLT